MTEEEKAKRLVSMTTLFRVGNYSDEIVYSMEDMNMIRNPFVLDALLDIQLWMISMINEGYLEEEIIPMIDNYLLEAEDVLDTNQEIYIRENAKKSLRLRKENTLKREKMKGRK